MHGFSLVGLLENVLEKEKKIVSPLPHSYHITFALTMTSVDRQKEQCRWQVHPRNDHTHHSTPSLFVRTLKWWRRECWSDKASPETSQDRQRLREWRRVRRTMQYLVARFSIHQRTEQRFQISTLTYWWTSRTRVVRASCHLQLIIHIINFMHVRYYYIALRSNWLFTSQNCLIPVQSYNYGTGRRQCTWSK